MTYTYVPAAADWLRILPELIVLGAALLTLIVDLFLPARRKAWLYVVALAGLDWRWGGDRADVHDGRRPGRLLWHGALGLDGAAGVSHYPLRRRAGHPLLARLSHAPDLRPSRRVLRAAPALDLRHDADVGGGEPDDRLRRAGGALAAALHPLRDSATRPALAGIGAEVFPAQLVRLGVPALWHRAHLRQRRIRRTSPQSAPS